jgi:hypothetical protein
MSMIAITSPWGWSALVLVSTAASEASALPIETCTDASGSPTASDQAAR